MLGEVSIEAVDGERDRAGVVAEDGLSLFGAEEKRRKKTSIRNQSQIELNRLDRHGGI
jgi:hypothetical protein